MENKIFLEKDDDLEKAVSQLVSSSAEKIILNIPKNSVLGTSVHNFQVLEREAMTAGKELAIESVDERVLELASLATIPAVNPVFKTRERAVANILPGASEGSASEEAKPVKKTGAKAVRKAAVKPRKTPVRKKKEVAEKIEETEILEVTRYEEKEPEPERKHEIEREREEDRESEPEIFIERKKARPGRGFKFKLAVSAVIVVVLGLGYWLVTAVLPKADITVSIEKTTLPFSFQVSADTSVNSPSASGNTISLPGQLSVAGGKQGNLSMNFLATGSSTVSTKASGMMTIHNDYSQNQTLVATTRFESPDGKIFRLVKQAAISKGKSVEAQVVADQPGSDYNVPPSQNWQIPGFKGKPQYGKIYGETKASMTGGASGNQVVPTADEIKDAKLKIESALSDNLKSQALILSSPNLKLLDNASVFKVTSETISNQVDENNNFSVLAVGELRQLVFDETMLKDSIMQSVAGTSTASVKIDDFSLNYGTSTADLAAGKMSFTVSGQVVYEPKIDFDAFKNQILGKDADLLKTMLFALPGLQKANISLWPFWVNSVPTRGARVNINVE